jgi:hypothetical protein
VLEIKKALKVLHNGRAAEANNISPEVMKVDLDITANMLHPYLRRYGLRKRCLMSGNVAY